MACNSPIKGYVSKDGGFTTNRRYAYIDRPMSVPCGNCLGCRLEKARQWAVRIVHESKDYDENMFLTLTYDDDNLPEGNTLVKEDVQLFMKRLRKYVSPKKIRYYLCGEYGEKFGRPHYHAIIFNHWPEKAEEIDRKEGEPIYTDENISSIWKKGFISFGKVTFDSANYVSQYVTKKWYGEKAEEHYKGRLPEFAFMSKRPGIGSNWLQKYGEETWRDNYIIVNGKKQSPPLYYKRKLKEENEELHSELKRKNILYRKEKEEKEKDDREFYQWRRPIEKERYLKGKARSITKGCL